jgi:hypothetical protein
MAFTIYRSTDASAPVLTGQVGSLLALLDAVLVNGYGAKAAAGWGKPFSGTNIAVYRPGVGVRHFFRIDDSASGTGGAKEAHVRGYGTKSNAADVPDGSDNADPFPTVAQYAPGSVMRKSFTADATARAWIIAADGRTCHIFVQTGDGVPTYYNQASFGEFYALNPSDAWRSHLHARVTANSSSQGAGIDGAYSASSGIRGHIPRAYSSIGSAVYGAVAILGVSNTQGAGGPLPAAMLPSPTNGGFYFSQASVWDGDQNNSVLRGRLRGIWWPLYQPGLNLLTTNDTFTGSGTTSGRTWFAIQVGAGAVLIETSDTLETNV